MAYNGQQIKVVEGNAFAMLFPLKARTYTLNGAPMDTDIDLEHLTNIVVKIGSTSYEYTKEAGGLQVMEDGSLAKGTYDIVITGEYWGDKVRAAYYQALVVVAWNNQSDAEQYIAGSPIVCDAAYLIAGVLTDAELEALKEEYREKNAQLDQAIADAEAARREWEQKAADLDGVAQEATSQSILTAVQASETTAQGTANKNEILAAIAANAGIPTLTIPDSTAAQELAPNVLYIFATRTSTLTLTLGTPIVGIANEYHFFVVCGSTAPTINFPAGITWNGGSAPTIAADKTYEVSILNNVAAYFEV